MEIMEKIAMIPITKLIHYRIFLIEYYLFSRYVLIYCKDYILILR